MLRRNADTWTVPEGITRRVALNLLEAFFRRRWLHLLPILFLTTFGVVTAIGRDAQYRSVATLSASDVSLLSQITTTNTRSFTAETPAQQTADQIHLFLNMEPFLRSVAAAAHEAVDGPAGEAKLSELRGAIGTSVVGDSLVQVSATTRDADMSRRLADATVSTYIEYVVKTSVKAGTDTERTTAKLVDQATTDRNAAHEDVKKYLERYPQSAGADAPPVLAQDLRLRQADFERAQARLSKVQDADDQAKQEAGVAGDAVRQRLVPLIPAVAPKSPEPVVRGAILTVAVFLVLGALLSLASVVVSATLDRSVRVPEDITSRYGLEVLAVVPDVSR
jgi:capsular polysaccharide biosynthesis protein